MTFETLALGLLAGYCIWRLYRSVFKETQPQPNKIRLISRQTGEVLEMQVIPQSKENTQKEWNEADFLTGAKWTFQTVMTAFASGQLTDVKNLMTSDVYTVLEQNIAHRRQQKNKMEFSLVCFDKADITHKAKDMSEIAVTFTTEQINLLKDEKGNTIEGDPMSITTVTDTWLFRKAPRHTWLLSATQSRPHTHD